MIFLDKDSYELMQYLLQLEQPETIMAISKTLNQSRRKVYYHLEKINEALPADTEPIVSKPRIGLLLTPQQREACEKMMKGMDSLSYILSMQERMELMLVCIAIDPQRITIDKLMTLTDVSRNTVLNDLNEIRHILESSHYRITLYATKSEGYFLKSYPMEKIQYVHSLMHQILTEENESFISIVESMAGALPGGAIYFSQEFRESFITCLKNLRHLWGKRLNLNEIDLMVQLFPYLMMAYQNISLTPVELEQFKQELAPVQERIEHSVAQEIAQNLEEQFSIQLSSIEIAILTILLLSYRKDGDEHIESDDFQYLAAVLDQFLNQIEANSTFVFPEREILRNRLLIHCKALVYRKRYGIFLRNPLTEQMKEKYHELFQIAKVSASILEKNWNIELNDDDIAYLTAHLGGAAQNNHMDILTRKICIVCDDGLALQQLLMKQLKQYFPLHQIEAVFSSEQFRSVQDIISVDLVVETADVVETSIPTVVVQPILSKEDVLRLSHALKQEAIFDTKLSLSNQLDQLLKPYVTGEEERKELSRQIQQLLTNEMR
ncbi:BglG family transcription antiterminator [Streptococcus sp. DD13]|uniref:BglG family transcription antiterminator n=1 Tax=Streptococcus sp. DD13 TaxID=1777881 RepID=UPI000796F75C|nr:transcription antiterminator [Streptococcus sp. DD13]KXT77640.1 Transcriptional antiterminator with PTS regulation domain [Streptococcus sp. DD13]